MTQRGFDDAFWGDIFIQSLEKDAKLLFAYLWTNKYCNPACLYEITPKTICFDTGINIDDLPRLFQSLELKISWYPEKNIVWVKNFVKRQSRSPKFLTAVAKSLYPLSKNGNTGIVDEFIDFNTNLGIPIPYRYPIDTLPIEYRYGIDTLTDTDTDTDTDTEEINDIENDTITKKIYGEFGNVKLTDAEYQKLLDKYGVKQVGVMIEALSAYMKSKKKRYSNHYATILNWFRRDEKDDARTREDKPRRLPTHYTDPEDL